MQLDQAIAQALSNLSGADNANKPTSKIDSLFGQLFPTTSSEAADSAAAAFKELAEAAVKGEAEIFSALIEAEKAQPPGNEPTLLMSAVMANEFDVAKALVAAGTDVNVKIKEFFEFNALHFAVKNQNAAMVKLLLEAGADPNWINKNPGFAPITKAVKESNAEIVRALLAHGAEVQFETGFKLIVEAAQCADAEVVDLLLEAGCDPNECDSNGSALRAASTRCNVGAVQALLAAGAEVDNGAFLSVFGAPFMAKQLSGLLGEQPDPTADIPFVIQAFIKAGVDVNGQGQDGTTALILAICENYKDVVEQLLAAGADPNLQGKLWAMMLYQSSDNQEVARQYAYRTTPLNLAVAFGYEEIVRSLLSHDANISLADEKGVLPIDVAVKEGHQEIVDLLKSAGATVNEEDTAAFDKALIGAAKKGNLDVLQSALEKGADPNANQPSNNRRKREKTAMMFASEQGHLEIVRLLVENGANVNLSDRPGKKLGKTPLMCAAQTNQFETVRFLLEQGAAVDAQNKRGQTALFYAVEEEAVEAVEVLLEYGSDVQKKGWDGTPFEIAVYSDPAIGKMITEADKAKPSRQSQAARVEMLSSAAFDNNVALVRDLIQQGVDVNGTEDGFSALMMAASQGYDTIVQILIAAGANVDAKDAEGETALFKAAYWGKPEIIKLLLSAGANANNTNTSGTTALMSTLVWNSADSVRVLLEAGADATAKNNEGYSVLAIARAERKRRIVEILQEAGVTE